MTRDALELGQRVLEAFDRGRERAIAVQRARGAETDRAVRRALDDDILLGHPARGRASRIARRTGIRRRTVADSLARLLSAANVDAAP